MKIAICDDNIKDIEILRHYILAHDPSHEVHEFTSSIQFLNTVFANNEFELVFLDIQMPDLDGWSIAKELKQARCRIYIAITTVLGDYIYDCFDRVDWFTPKPFTQEKIFKILDNAMEKLHPPVFGFEAEHVRIALTAPEILYLEVRRNDLLINTYKKCFSIRMPLKSALSILSPYNQFVQIHNSYVINLLHYKEFDGSDIVLKNGVHLRLTRTYRKHFFETLSEYIRGE